MSRQEDMGEGGRKVEQFETLFRERGMRVVDANTTGIGTRPSPQLYGSMLEFIDASVLKLIESI